MTYTLLLVALVVAVGLALLKSGFLFNFNSSGPGSAGNTHTYSYSKPYFWPLLSRALNRKSNDQHPFSINPKKMGVIAKKNLCLRNSSRASWFQAVSSMPYQIPLFTLTSDEDVVRTVQDDSPNCYVNGRKLLGLKIADNLRIKGKSVEKSFDSLCEDIRRRQIFRHVHCPNYDLLLNQYDTSPKIDDFGRYPGGGRVYESFNSESLVFRATLTEDDYVFIQKQSELLIANLLLSSTRLHQPQKVRVCATAGPSAFFHSTASDSTAFKNRIALFLATEIIWAKLANFINLPEFTEDYQPHVAQAKTPSAFSDADSANLTAADYAKLANYAPNAKWFTELKSDIQIHRIPTDIKLPRKFN